MAKSVKVIVTEDGQVTFDFDGFAGDTCMAGLDALLKEFEREGISVADVQTTRKKREQTTSTGVQAHA